MDTQTKTLLGAEEQNRKQARETWVQVTNRLLDEITEWVAVKNWSVRREPRVITEEALGTYTVPDVIIDTPSGQLMLEVKAHGVPEAPGRVELSAWPTLYRVMLLHRANESDWKIYTDSGISLRQPWTQETFLTLAEDLLAAS